MARRRTDDSLFFGGPSVEPTNSPSWKRARKAGRTKYYQELARLLDIEHQQQTIEGRDRRNVFLRRLRRSRTGDYEGAPGKPLNPWRELSRVNRNRRWAITEKGCRLYWAGRIKPDLSVQRLLAAHAHRFGEYAPHNPARDVMGLAPSRVQRAVAEARKWWAKRHPEDKRPKTPSTVGGVPERLIPVAARPIARQYPMLARYLVPPDRRPDA